MALDKITALSIADNAVTSTQIGVDVIVADDIAANAITVAELQDGAVTHAKLHNTMDLSSKTLTLPPNVTVTGNLTVDTNTLYVNASNNRVGIGTTSPADHLSVVTTGANAQLSVDRSDGGAGRTVLIHSSTGGQLQTTGSVPLIFGTADIERMRIDAAGRVTKPNQPSFMVYGGWSYQSSTNIWQGFATVDHNIGSHWNNSIGRFTAPVAGRYMIYATAHHSAANTYHLWAFLKNGSLGGGNWVQSWDATGGANTTSKTQVWNLAAGDYLEVASNGTYPNGYTGGYVTVGGHLVG